MPPSALLQPVIVAIERPVNNAFLLLHVKAHLTDEMAEKYGRATSADAPNWLRPAFDFQTISDIHLMRHRIRFRTYKKRYDWQPFIDHIAAELAPNMFGNCLWKEVDPSPPRRRFRSPNSFEQLLVIEGYTQSRSHALISILFDIEGVIEIKATGATITIKKSPLYHWSEIENQLPSDLIREGGDE